jgi:hypothetical protein
MDTNRQLAEGETFVNTDRPLVVNLQFKPTAKHPEQVGECMLPRGTKVAQKSGILQWVAECGNDEVNKNIFIIPFTLLKGDKGDKGDEGYTPIKGKDYFDGENGKNPPRRPLCGESLKTGRRWGCIALAILVGGGAYTASQGGGDTEHVTTLPPCTGLPCN